MCKWLNCPTLSENEIQLIHLIGLESSKSRFSFAFCLFLISGKFELIVQPYTRASQSGITPVAYFYDTPLVVSNINGLKEIIQRDKSGEVFNNSAKELSIAILNTIKNDKQELYISNIRKAKIKYTWLRFIKELEKI